VFSVCWDLVNHRDTENTEVAQKRAIYDFCAKPRGIIGPWLKRFSFSY